MKRNERTNIGMMRQGRLLLALVGLVLLSINARPVGAHSPLLHAQKEKGSASGEKLSWKTVDFAIVRYNNDAPASWNMYHGEKKGMLLIRLWRRYLFLNVQDQEVYELDPQKVTVQGDNTVQWSPSDPISMVHGLRDSPKCMPRASRYWSSHVTSIAQCF